jgi:hypothetical protein
MPTASSEDAAVERVAFPVPVFCGRNNLSEPSYYKMRAQGLGPKEMRIGTKVLITLAAEAEWQRARENPKGAEAAEIARTAKALQKRARRAAAKSIASPLHVSRCQRSKAVA